MNELLKQIQGVGGDVFPAATALWLWIAANGLLLLVLIWMVTLACVMFLVYQYRRLSWEVLQTAKDHIRRLEALEQLKPDLEARANAFEARATPITIGHGQPTNGYFSHFTEEIARIREEFEAQSDGDLRS